ncbi:hypothetical protein AL486_18945 [Pandoraea apista]|nr:hypothetical protein AL486_18945 [Pandoraea apista]
MKVDAVDNPVPLVDRANSRARQLCNFSVCVASEEQCTLALHGGAQLSFIGVGHLYRLGVDLISYSSLRQEAVREWNATRPKQELGQPHLLTRALMESGWINRQTIIWHKPNPMPESVRDRCTKAHEYLFLLTKSERYFFDADAIKEDASGQVPGNRHPLKGVGQDEHSTRSGLHAFAEKARNARDSFRREGSKRAEPIPGQSVGTHRPDRADSAWDVTKRNRRSVWTVATTAYHGAHFATFPESLVEPCVLAGSRPSDIVFDPFMGSGTVAQVASRLGRHYLGCELNPEYFALQRDRTRQPGLQLEIA